MKLLNTRYSRKKILASVIVITSITLLACTPKQPEQTLERRLIEKSLIYKDNSNKKHRYSLSIPKDINSQHPLPVIVYLHGKGGNENSELIPFSQYVDNIIHQCGVRSPIIIFPSNEKGLYLLDQNYHIAKGLLDLVNKNYTLEKPSKRIISGFSIGGAAATRTAITNPMSFAASYSWAGGLWPKDTYLFDSVKKHAELLKEKGFKASLYIGGNDSPELYNPLIVLFEQYGINYKRVLLEDQNHNLGKYFKRTKEIFKNEICSIFNY